MYDATATTLESTFTSDIYVEQTKQSVRRSRLRSDLAKAIAANEF